MDETKPKENTYSRERIETTPIQVPAEGTNKAELPPREAAAPLAQPALKLEIAAMAESVRANWPASFAELPQFVKQTKRVWLTLAGGVAGLLAMAILMQHVAEWIRYTRERRQEQAIATVTPERLIARCGNAAQDETKEVYPIVMRTMSYQRGGNETLVMAFSRTAEEKSDWVFLSMRDASGTTNYETPEAKIAALPCLNSKK